MTAAARDPHERDVTPIVIILRKTQGSVWREAGRTELCPTLDWLRERYGHGEYELQLKLGNRIVCMVKALAQKLADAADAQLAGSSRAPLLAREGTAREGTRIAAGSLGFERRGFVQRKFA